jgi:hypothetical protein
MEIDFSSGSSDPFTHCPLGDVDDCPFIDAEIRKFHTKPPLPSNEMPPSAMTTEQTVLDPSICKEVWFTGDEESGGGVSPQTNGKS